MTAEVEKALRDKSFEVISSRFSSSDELKTLLSREHFDLVWSGLYYMSEETYCNGEPDNQPWIPEILDQWAIPYVGSNGEAMRRIHDKFATLQFLAENGLPTPHQLTVNPEEKSPKVAFPAFVKPCYESESEGISEKCVVTCPEELERQLYYVHRGFFQKALVEEYLPGRELTVSMLGNGQSRIIRPVVNILDPATYENYPVLTNDLKLQHALEFKIPEDREDVADLAARVFDCLGCRDHARVDMREDAHGNLKVIEVNASPGLDPQKSRSLQIFRMYQQDGTPEDCYRELLELIVNGAADRVGVRGDS